MVSSIPTITPGTPVNCSATANEMCIRDREERDKIVHEARKQAEIAAQKELDAVKQQIQMEKDEAIRDIRRQVAVLSVDIAEKVLRKSLEDKDAQMGMIDRMLDEVLTPNKN